MKIPRMKAAHIQTNLLNVQRLPEAEEILSRYPEASVEAVRDVPGSLWLPLEYDLDLTRTVYEVIGLARANDWAHDCILDAVDRPYLKPFFGGVRALFGMRIRHMLKFMAPHAFLSIYKDCGELSRGEELSDMMELIWDGVPPELLETPGYLDGCAAAIAAAFELCGVRGDFSVSADRDLAQARMRFGWIRVPHSDFTEHSPPPR